MRTIGPCSTLFPSVGVKLGLPIAYQDPKFDIALNAKEKYPF